MSNATKLAPMAPSLAVNPMETTVPDDTIMDNDDSTVVTETPTTKTGFIEAEMRDQLLRYKIPFTTGHPKDDGFKLHIQLLIAITKAFD